MRLIYKWNYIEPKWKTEFYFNVTDDGTLVICFCGSSDIVKDQTDWIQNCMAWTYEPNDYSFAYDVHYGLYQKWLLTQKMIDHLTNMKLGDFDKVHISGYSQGGAMAVFCHRWLSSFRTPWNIKTVAAGCPKVFGHRGLDKNKKICKNITVLQYKDDIVSKLPTFWLNHVGNIIPRGESQWWRFSIEDHLIKNYQEWAETI